MLVADLYELTMAAVYCRLQMQALATFSLFVRKLPRDRGFLVAAGVDDALDRLVDWRIRPEDVAWLAQQLDLPRSELGQLENLGFTGDAWAVREGTIVLAGEPLIEVTAPLPEAQVVESTLLNAVTYQTAIATKAARCRIAAAGTPVVDFSLRRDHGVEAATAAARAGAVAGFVATSNVGAAQSLGLTATGTMAHSFVQAFPTETDAFEAFATTFPARPTFLVDTYDTARGVRVAVDVIKSHALDDVAAVRLDSGDLAEEAVMTRGLLDAAGLPSVRIIVSGGVDEYVIDELKRRRAPVDVFAVGTRVGTAADAPVLDSAYKLVEYDGHPLTKLSPGKGYLPGPKQVWRRDGMDDLLAARDEPDPAEGEPLLELAVRGGHRARRPGSVDDASRRLARGLAMLPEPARRVRGAEAPVPTVTARLQRLAQAVTSQLVRRQAPQEHLDTD